MIYKRHYIQFNDLVFDHYDMVAEDEYSISYKYNSTAYGFKHGDYAPIKDRVVEASTTTLTLTLNMKKLPCEVRKYYPDFVETQLNAPGKLWAVYNDTLIWAYAVVSNMNFEADPQKDTLVIDVEFQLYEGIWHKANLQKTFLVPFDRCDFMDCYDYHELKPCITTDCCHCTHVENTYCDCCDCNELDKDMALCYHTEELQSFYTCNSEYKVVYNCYAAEKYFGSGTEHLGQKFCNVCGGLISGQLYSDTVLPTDGIKVTIKGKMHNPSVEINGNVNYIAGDYDGVLTINSDGSVYFSEDECCENLISASNWKVPKGNTYGWKVNAGNNQLVVDAGKCCSTVCAYIEIDSIL